MVQILNNYDNWCSAFTFNCGLAIEKAHCGERLTAFAYKVDPTTKVFLSDYCSDDRDLVISLFTLAPSEV